MAAPTITELALTAIELLHENGSPHCIALADYLSATAAQLGAAPEAIDAPYASQTGSTLNCTMGNWSSMPASYAWQWQSDATDVAGATAETYTVVPADVGHTFTCNVTATNVAGSGTSTSNGVVVA